VRELWVSAGHYGGDMSTPQKYPLTRHYLQTTSDNCLRGFADVVGGCVCDADGDVLCGAALVIGQSQSSLARLGTRVYAARTAGAFAEWAPPSSVAPGPACPDRRGHGPKAVFTDAVRCHRAPGGFAGAANPPVSYAVGPL